MCVSTVHIQSRGDWVAPLHRPLHGFLTWGRKAEGKNVDACSSRWIVCVEGTAYKT